MMANPWDNFDLDEMLDLFAKIMQQPISAADRVYWLQALDGFTDDVMREAFMRAMKTMRSHVPPEWVADIARAVIDGLPEGYAVTADNQLMVGDRDKIVAWQAAAMGRLE